MDDFVDCEARKSFRERCLQKPDIICILYIYKPVFTTNTTLCQCQVFLSTMKYSLNLRVSETARIWNGPILLKVEIMLSLKPISGCFFLQHTHDMKQHLLWMVWGCDNDNDQSTEVTERNGGDSRGKSPPKNFQKLRFLQTYHNLIICI